MSDDGNELERLEAQRKAIDAKIAAELARRKMIMEGTEATPNAKALFDNSLIISSKVEELSRKCAQLEKGQKSEAKQKEEDKLSKVEAENRLLKAELKQRETIDELKEMKTKVAKMEQQEYALVEQIHKLEEGQKKCLDKCAELENELARKLGKLLKAELKQRKMMDEINGLKKKVAKMEQQQQKEDVCIGQFAKLLTRIDQIEAQINELKEKDEEEGSLSTSVPAVEDNDDDISEHSDSTRQQTEGHQHLDGWFVGHRQFVDYYTGYSSSSSSASSCSAKSSPMKTVGQQQSSSSKRHNGHQMQIHVKTLRGHTHTLSVRPSNTIEELKAKIEDIEGVPIMKQRLIFDGKQLEDNQTLAHYDIENGESICLVERQCGC